jgi:hypothetical protein
VIAGVFTTEEDLTTRSEWAEELALDDGNKLHWYLH